MKNSILIGKINEGGKDLNVKIDFSASGKENLSFIAVGASGSGKTVECQKLMMELAKNNARVLVIDIHGTSKPDQIFYDHREDFEKLANRYDGYMNPIKYPLFNLRIVDNSANGTNLERVSDKASRMTASISRSFRLGDNQECELKEAITAVINDDAYKNHGIVALRDELMGVTEPKFDNVIGHTKKTKKIPREAKSIYNKLYTLLEHNSFEEGEFFWKEGKINILDISYYAPKEQKIICNLLLDSIWSDTTSENTIPTYIVIDEFQNLGLEKNGALATILTEGRKKNLNCLLITQSLGGFFDGPQQKLLSQTRYQLIFRPASADLKSFAGIVDPFRSPETIDALRRMKVGEFFVSGPIYIGEDDKPFEGVAILIKNQKTPKAG